MQNCDMATFCNLGRGFKHKNGGRRPFFWSSPNFGPKTGLNLSEDLFFFGLHLILGMKTDLVLSWKIFILIFITLKFSEFPALPPYCSPVYTLVPNLWSFWENWTRTDHGYILQRWSPRGHILKSLSLTLASKVKSLALASKPQVLENCPVLGSRTALFFEPLKFRWKTPETSQKICEHLFCFPHLEHRRNQGGGGQGVRPLPITRRKWGVFVLKVAI